jgi:nucleoside-diphosphate-sugar epimerase
MVTIGIVGANGRVGSEVTLLLSLTGAVAVVPIVRTSYGASFLRRLGIQCRIGSLTDEPAASELLDGVDLVADFSLPQGLPSHVRKGQRANLRAVLRHAPARAGYAFISSTMVFGVDAELRYRDFRFARTLYAANKRHGERSARLLGAAAARRVYVLRLGEVHGELQQCSRDLMHAVDDRPIALPLAGAAPSDAVHCATIAASLIHVASGRASRGTYTLIEDPPLSLAQLYEHYGRGRGVVPRFEDAGLAAAPSWEARLKTFVVDQREFLTAQLLPAHGTLEQRIRSPHHLRSAASQISAMRRGQCARPSHRFGDIPGRRLQLSSDEIAQVRRAEPRLRALLEHHNGPDGHVLPIDLED